MDVKITPEKIKTFRNNPIVACKYLLNIKLTWFQAIMLKTAWTKPFTLWLCSRALGKTFMAAIYLILKCLLYKNVKAGIYAKSYEQSLETFEKIKDIYYNSPILQNETFSEPKIDKTKAVLRFKNRSSIVATAIRRGPRRNIVFVDEYREVDPEEIRQVVEPMLLAKHKDIENNLLIASSAAYEFNHFYAQYKFFESEIKKGNKDYGLCVFDIDDALTGPWIDEKIVEGLKARLLPEEIEMELYCKFVSLRDGWITGHLIRSCELEYAPEIKGEPGFIYFISADTGRVKGGDNSSFCVCKVVPNEGVRVVRIVALNGKKFDEQAMILRQLVRDFNNVEKLIMDYEKGGMAVADVLENPAIDPRDGEYLPPIVLEDDVETEGALRIIKSVNFADKTAIWNMGLETKKAIQNQILHFPKDEYKVYLSEDEVMCLKEDERERYLMFREMSELKKETCNIQVKPNETNTSFSFVVPNNPKKNKDDRFTSLILCASEAIKYYKEISENNDDDFIGYGTSIRGW